MKKRQGSVLIGFWVAAVLVALGALASVPQPEYWPLCQSPQNIAPMQPAGGNRVSAWPDMVWNGQDFAVAWVDDGASRLQFRRFFADGTPAGAVVTPSTKIALGGVAPSLVWNGSGYGVAWMAFPPTDSVQIYFARLHADGTLDGTEVKASLYGFPNTTSCWTPSLAWNGSGYAVAWADFRNFNNEIFATLLDASGGVVSADIPITAVGGAQSNPSIVWSKAAGKWVIVWQDHRSVTHDEIYATYIVLPSSTGSHTLLVSGSSDSQNPRLVDTGNGLGMTWMDFRDGNSEIYFARLDAWGSMKFGSDVRLTTDGSDSWYPAIVWTGAEYGVFWPDNRSGNFEIWFQRVGAAGAPQGANTQVTVSAGMAFVGAAFARYGYLISGSVSSLPNFVMPLGCNWDSTPPTCPGGFVAYNITGTSATIGWLPSGEDFNDVAYYQVYRNALPIAITSGTYFSDSGLGLSTTYAYAVQPVNAAQMQNYTCQTTFYVKTNATLLLKVDKNSPDARLTWTDIYIGNYNIFRGTSPQVMHQIGATGGRLFDDPNVLVDSNIYFYTVDEPGW